MHRQAVTSAVRNSRFSNVPGEAGLPIRVATTAIILIRGGGTPQDTQVIRDNDGANADQEMDTLNNQLEYSDYYKMTNV